MTAKDNAIKLADWLLEQAYEKKPTGIPDNSVDCGGFIGDMYDHDLGLLGAGAYSMVFEHPDAPGMAIKLCIDGDDSAPVYLAWARANPGPHIPRVHHLKRNANYVVAVLDRLYPMDEEARRVYKNNLNVGLSLVTDHPVSKAAQKIRNFFAGACNFDLHRQNCMMDKNKQLVLTDPVSGSDSNESRALRTGIERAFDIAA